MNHAYNHRAYRRYRATVKATRPTCHICGQPGADTVDHLLPLNLGGTNTPDNWAPAHAHCNYAKRDRIRHRYHAPH